MSEDRLGVRFVVPVTAGFFDFSPVDVIAEGPPSRVDSFSVVPGVELDHEMGGDWHFIPYARAGFSVASSSVDGWLYGTGFRLERNAELNGWDTLFRTEVAFAGVDLSPWHCRRSLCPDTTRHSISRAARMAGPRSRDRVRRLRDLRCDPRPADRAPRRRERAAPAGRVGITFATRPRIKLWHFDAPRIGFGYRIAGDVSAFRIVLGVPFLECWRGG